MEVDKLASEKWKESLSVLTWRENTAWNPNICISSNLHGILIFSGHFSSSGLGEKLDSCLSPDKPMEGLAGGNKQKSGVEYFAKSLNDRLGHLGWINKGIITQGL